MKKLHSQESEWRVRLFPMLLAVGVLIVTWGYAALSAWSTHRDNERQIASRLDSLAGQIVEELRSRFRLYEYGLRGARGAIISAGGNRATHDDFARYMRSRDLPSEFPGARGFGYIERVSAADLSTFVAAAEADRGSAFRVVELGANSGAHFIIKYVEPESLNASAVGLDIASEQNRRNAALASMLSARATLTAPITLVQATGARDRGMLFLFPVYADDQQPAEESREQNLIGWVYAPVVTDEILKDFASSHANIALTISDVSAAGSAQEIYANQLDVSGRNPAYERSRDASIYGRKWRLELSPNPLFLSKLDLPVVYIAAGWIAAGGALLALVSYLLATTARRRRRAMAQRARLATIVEDSHDAIIGTSLDGVITEWNNAATDFFGYDADEAIGRPIADTIVPPRYVDEDRTILRRVLTGESLEVGESVRRRKDGSTLFVQISASPIRDGHGRIVGAAKTLRNITERKEAERKILELNASLEEQVQRRTAELRAFSALHKAILTNAGYAIIATDPGGTITLFNPAAESMLGYTSDEMVGKQTPVRFHDRDEVIARADRLREELDRDIKPGFDVFVAKAQDAPDVNEWTYIRRSGERIPVLVNVSTLRGDDGAISGYLGIAASLAELKQREIALEVSERKLRGLFELSTLGIALTDQSGRFVEFNESYRALTGYSEKELHTMNFWQLTPPEYLQEERAVLASLENTGHYGPYNKHYVRKDGFRVSVRLNGVTLRLDGKPYTWSIVEDTTEQRLTEAAMLDAVEAAEAASMAKSNFLANISHEIRTPMNATLGMLQLLRRTALDDKQRDYASKAEMAATTLLALLNDVLDFSKIEAGRQTLESHEFDLDQLLREISVIASANVGNKRIELVFDIDRDIPGRLIGDSLRIRQVLINLVGNAVKFTETGEVKLIVRLLSAEDGHVSLHFEVADTGIGIAADKLSSIFEGFSQAEASTTRRYGGSGLGLAICRKLVALMGGELKVESQLGVGSRFHFVVELDATVSEQVRTSAQVMHRLWSLRVLAVDDSHSTLEAVADIVHSLGWSCDTVDNGPAALRRILSGEANDIAYDVILLDWSMPDMDGWEVGEEIRRNLPTDKCPLIVMVTMHEREKVIERCATSGNLIDGFLVKPITASMLLDAVADALATHSSLLSSAKAHPTRANETARLKALRILVVEDNPTNQQVAKDLLELEGAIVEVADNGNQALRMLEENSLRADLVLMDIQMPDMDGFTVTRLIRDTPSTKELPIIAMTANVMESDRLACLAAGMNDHVGKPFDLNVLVETIHHWVGTKEPTDLAGSTSANIPTSSTDKTLDYAAALARFGGHISAYQAALNSFLYSAQDNLGQLQSAVTGGEVSETSRILHTLKGVAATVGANQLVQLIVSTEKEVASRPAEWKRVVPLQEIRAAAETVFGAIRQRLDEMESVGTAAPKQDISRSDIEKLLVLLRASSMKAVDHYETIKDDLARSSPEFAMKLQAALGRFNFREASAICDSILHSHQIEP